jgi:DNA repair exonuclease SbcCD ATPase subunit
MNPSSETLGAEKNRFVTMSAIFVGAFVGLFISQVYTLVMFYRLGSRTESLNQIVQRAQEATSEGIAKVNHNSSSFAAMSRRKLTSFQEELEQLKHQPRASTGPGDLSALNSVQGLVKKLDNEREEQKERHDELVTKLSELKQVTGAANVTLAGVSDDVKNVKEEIAFAKTDLNRTASDLKKVVGDMGVMSGLIATNAEELKALRTLGDRAYFEFNLSKSKDPKRIGDIAVLLKKADPAKKLYTLEVYLGHQKVQKKDKTTNEPIQFYTTKSRQPYEIVVNAITKDHVIGYLAAPGAAGYGHSDQTIAALR